MTETKPKKMGRPPKAEAATARIGLRVTHQDKELLSQAADIAGISTSMFIISVARERAAEIVRTKSVDASVDGG